LGERAVATGDLHPYTKKRGNSVMKKWKKITIGIAAVLLAVGIVTFSIHQANKDVVTVQTGKVAKADVTSIVTASGEVRPKTYTNVLGEGFGKITEIVVKEGDHVKRGDILLRLESIQPAADVAAQEASTSSSDAAIRMTEANYKSAQATQQQRQSDLDKAKLDWGRSQELYKEQLIAKQEYDSAHAAYDSAAAAFSAAQAQLQQEKAALEQAHSNLRQNQAQLTHQRDVLRKTTYTAPIDGLVTYIAMRVGETVVPGIQSSAGSFLMTISDMSVVTAEVRADETDITNLRNGQKVTVTIDALPGKSYTGKVTEVGDQAILRTSGLATTQTTSNTQEARDFKVVVTLDNPPDDPRPGLSCTAKIETAHKAGVVAIPIQAIAIRTRKELADAESRGPEKAGVTLAAAKPDASGDPAKDEIQGVFVIRNGHAQFVPVQTGISGITDIEVTNGLQAGDEIITGSYKVLRTIRPNSRVKVDNSAPKQTDQSSS
jgi:HlyD family secretion protein